MTRRQVCELIQLRLAGGTPSQDFEPTLSEINYWLDFGAADSAMKNYAEGVSVDGVEFVGDAFYSTVRVVLQEDAQSPYLKAALPTMPSSLPRGYDVTTLVIATGSRSFSKPALRISLQQADYYKRMPRPHGSNLFFFKDGSVFIDSEDELAGKTAVITMASTSVDRSLDAPFYAPDGAMSFIMEYVMKNLGIRAPQDKSNDGNNIA